MTKPAYPIAITASEAPPRAARSIYPEPFASRMEGRTKHLLGRLFGLTNFGVNLTRIAPGGMSALRHAHARQDEFIFILEGNATLVTDAGETHLSPGMCAGFKAGTGDAHHLVNKGATEVVYLEVGDRTPGDTVTYPDDDIAGEMQPDGHWRFFHKDGSPY
jgi:uncharacterized cupin superfamily protein